ncbi:MAG: AAA family ATPase [Planctomycetes bacterium]|nr:AAA family ATPase [Planctomycetota bacterium]
MTNSIVIKRDNDSSVYILLLDLDACRDTATGEVASWAIKVVESCKNTYTEVSPSGTGLRIVVALASLPADVRAKVDVPHPAPDGVTKRPQIQLFGLGPAGYVTMTGLRLDGANDKVVVIESLDAIVDEFGMRVTKDVGPRVALEAVKGEGDPPSMEEITAEVLKHSKGREMIAGEWRSILPSKSPSEVFNLLVPLALACAHGHGEAALEWLLDHTAFGQGAVEGSCDPKKYTREKWVSAEIERSAARRLRPEVVFEDLGTPLAPSQSKQPCAPAIRPTTTILRVVSLAEAIAAPPIEWLADRLIPKIGVGILGGVANVGKTAIALDLALHIAHGRDYRGHAVAGGSVLYFASEGMAGLGARAAAWHAAHGLQPVLPDGRIFDLVSGLPSLSTEAGRSTLRQSVIGATTRGSPVRFAVIDTLSGHWAESEDKAEFVAPAMADLQRIAVEYGMALMLLHHERKPQSGAPNGGAMAALRGSTAWAGSADTILSASGDSDCVNIQVAKQRDGERAPNWFVALRTVGYVGHGGAQRTSVVAMPTVAHASVPADPAADDAADVDAVVDALRQLGHATRIDTIVKKARLRLQDGRAAFDRALTAGRIVSTGSLRRRTYRISTSQGGGGAAPQTPGTSGTSSHRGADDSGTSGRLSEGSA